MIKVLLFSLPPGYIKKHFACKNCDKTFENATHYQKHIKDHKNEGSLKENIEKWFCDQCGRDFANKTGWITHHKFKHGGLPPELQQDNSEGSIMCEVCSRLFETEKKLRRHKIETHDKKPAKNRNATRIRNCPHCDKTFSKIAK